MDLDSPNGHVGFSSFGLNRIEQEGQLDALIRELPAVRATAAEVITLSCYQTEYGIYNHDRYDRGPLSLVAQHPKENSMEGGALFVHIRRFFHYRLSKLFGLSLSEFLELPPFVVELLYEIARADATQQDKTHTEVQRQLNLDFEDDGL